MIITKGETVTTKVTNPDRIEFEPDVDEQDVTLCAYCLQESNNANFSFSVSSMQYGLAKEVLGCELHFPGFVVTKWQTGFTLPGSRYLALAARYLGNGFRVLDQCGAPADLHASTTIAGTAVCVSHIAQALKAAR